MTERRQLELAWSSWRGQSCLELRGWTGSEWHALAGPASAWLGQRLVVLPSALVDASVSVGALQPMAGRLDVEEEAIRFIPRFPFLDGTSYSVLVDSGTAGPSRVVEIGRIQRPPRPSVRATEVTAIYPTATELPVNALRLYVYFSNAMSEGWAARAVHVRTGIDGAALENVLLAMEPELWDSQRRRLTLLLEPGRIKRGLGPHQESGYPLREGVPIVVTIEAAFRDSTGQPLRASAERRYHVGPPVRARVDPNQWSYQLPTAGSSEPLTITFDRPLDRALLEHSLLVLDPSGPPRDGESVVGSGERWWRFTPRLPWTDGLYQIGVDRRLEDVAGNSLTRVFDRDLTRPEDTPTAAGPVAIDFTCSAPITPLLVHRQPHPFLG